MYSAPSARKMWWRLSEIPDQGWIAGRVGGHGEPQAVPPDVDVGPVLHLDRDPGDLGHDPHRHVVLDRERTADLGGVSRPSRVREALGDPFGGKGGPQAHVCPPMLLSSS